MKKVICLLLTIVSLACIMAPSHEAEAQIVYSRKCCDGNGVVRCILENWTPVGNPCFCYGQGSGWTC